MNFRFVKKIIILISLMICVNLTAENLRHLAIPYANFNNGVGGGLSIDIIKGFCQEYGYDYQYVETNWGDVFKQLLGTDKNGQGQYPIEGDLIASGLTVLDWRTKIVDFSEPIFPTQVWLLVEVDSPIKPIEPTGDLEKDILLTKQKLNGVKLLCKPNTCLDPSLYSLYDYSPDLLKFDGKLNEFAPALLKGMSDAILLDVPDVLITMKKWPRKFKIIGPISEIQDMAVAFRKSDKKMKDEFNQYLAKIQSNGQYLKLIKEYYPTAGTYFPEFFKNFK